MQIFALVGTRQALTFSEGCRTLRLHRHRCDYLFGHCSPFYWRIKCATAKEVVSPSLCPSACSFLTSNDIFQ